MSGGAFLPLWPPQASAYAAQVDWLVIGFTALMVLFIAPVFVALGLFIYRYRRGRVADRGHRPSSDLRIELAWVLLPFVGALLLFGFSARLFLEARQPPAGALEIDVVARQWMWKFQHPGGQREINALHVPRGRPVRLRMISEDVIHSLYVPALRLKQDVLPGRYTELWFQADVAGDWPGYCAEFCGTDHAGMLLRLLVQEPADYARWLDAAGSPGDLASQGAGLFRQLGCSGCHESERAPALAGLYGREVALADGGSVRADDAYLRDSLLLPAKQVVAGYPPIMPTYANLLDEAAIQRLLAYLRSLAERAPREARP
ncbi:cytochrome c oxidase subunit II [Pseudomonas sp. 273]|uniref:cytochrome c oxidase subunit II n=1 Tax=Pseudomonas sp. 273 TaxID=75692 RepID=UPI0023D86B8D|nr:cytochrome c oxidase subunit II [Pseudomonas sp. 273]